MSKSNKVNQREAKKKSPGADKGSTRYQDALRLSQEHGLPMNTVYKRLERGTPLEEACRPVGIPPVPEERYELVLRTLAEFQRTNMGQAPTIAQLSEACGFNSTSTTFRYLRTLHQRGKVIKVQSKFILPGTTAYVPPPMLDEEKTTVRIQVG